MKPLWNPYRWSQQHQDNRKTWGRSQNTIWVIRIRILLPLPPPTLFMLTWPCCPQGTARHSAGCSAGWCCKALPPAQPACWHGTTTHPAALFPAPGLFCHSSHPSASALWQVTVNPIVLIQTLNGWTQNKKTPHSSLVLPVPFHNQGIQQKCNSFGDVEQHDLRLPLFKRGFYHPR